MIKPITKIILFVFFFLPFVGNSQCHYTIDMQDSYGDGWNGASVDVDINGVPVTSFGFTNGNTFTSISSISAQNLLAQTLQLTLIDGKSAKDAVSEGMEIMTEAIE